MGGKSAPQAPNPYQSAQAQYEYGTQAATYNKALNAPNVVGPTGSTATKISGYDPTTGAPIYTTTNTLTAPEQQILGEGQGTTIAAGAQARANAGQPTPTNVTAGPIQTSINTSGIPGIPGAGDLSGFTQQAQDAAYKQATQYLDPQFSQEQEQLDAQLRNSGAQPGSAAYDNAMTLFNNKKQQAYQSAEEGAVGQGLQEQQALYGEGANTNQQLFGEQSAEGQFSNAAEAQGFGQGEQSLESGIQLRELPLQEYESLVTGQPLPSFGLGGAGGGATGTVSAPNIMDAFNQQYQGELANYNANVSSQNADVGALGTVAAALIASDRRLKKAIRRIGETARGLPLYLFRYISEPDSAPLRRGVMAQDLLELLPQAVLEDERGNLLVNYALVR